MKQSEERKQRNFLSSVCKLTKEIWERMNYHVPDLPGEEWRSIPNMMYEVSNYARVKRVKHERYCNDGNVKFYGERLITPQIQTNKKTGRQNVYVRLVTISGGQKAYLLSRIVAKVFVCNPDPTCKIQVNHKDENPLNNLPSNLEWVTPKENINYGNHNSRVSVTAKERFAKMTAQERADHLKAAREKIKRKVICDSVIYESAADFCRSNGLNQNTVGHWFTGYTAMPEIWRKKGLKYIG